MAKERLFTSVDQLPDDPFAMPPPYWRGGGSWDQLDDALSRLVQLLHELADVAPGAKEALNAFQSQYARKRKTDKYSQELRRICDPAWRIENRIILKCELVILMAAIHIEELVNKLVVYNLPRDLGETLEKLSPTEKLVAAASHLGGSRVKSTAAHSDMSELFRWQNGFAHGHCVDRPTKSLRHNHLITPGGYIGLPESINTVGRHMKGFERVVRYLSSISKNAYTQETIGLEPFAAYRKQLARFHISESPLLCDIAVR